MNEKVLTGPYLGISGITKLSEIQEIYPKLRGACEEAAISVGAIFGVYVNPDVLAGTNVVTNRYPSLERISEILHDICQSGYFVKIIFEAQNTKEVLPAIQEILAISSTVAMQLDSSVFPWKDVFAIRKEFPDLYLTIKIYNPVSRAIEDYEEFANAFLIGSRGENDRHYSVMQTLLSFIEEEIPSTKPIFLSDVAAADFQCFEPFKKLLKRSVHIDSGDTLWTQGKEALDLNATKVFIDKAVAFFKK